MRSITHAAYHFDMTQVSAIALSLLSPFFGYRFHWRNLPCSSSRFLYCRPTRAPLALHFSLKKGLRNSANSIEKCTTDQTEHHTQQQETEVLTTILPETEIELANKTHTLTTTIPPPQHSLCTLTVHSSPLLPSLPSSYHHSHLRLQCHLSTNF